MELIQIITITRHGQRSPCFSYQNDPYKDMWKQGLCQITDNGIGQLKEFGSFLRNNYRDFIPNHFHKKYVYVKSSDTDRTIISALAAMQGVFENQMVPIHTVPKKYDYLLKMCSVCPYHSSLLQEEFRSEKYKEIINEFDSLFKELGRGTGLDNVDMHLALRICDGVSVWHQLGLPPPAWLNASSTARCKRLSHLKFIISYSREALTRFRGGPLVAHVLDNLQRRARHFLADGSGLRLVSFFTHDSTLSAFLSHIGCFNRLQPPLASAVIVELHHDPSEAASGRPSDELSAFVVRFLFRNDSSRPPLSLSLPACSQTGCRLDELVRSLRPTFVVNMTDECRINVDRSHGNDGPVEDDRHHFVVRVVAPIIATEVFVLWVFYRLFRR